MRLLVALNQLHMLIDMRLLDKVVNAINIRQVMMM